eukprot:TRINITY_DN48206_c0_g1_i1.p1 TRINITY_DN48206_c0_g1~~TRINITY_DN48206_c0_g1_i1.p1  ORF type:complete len:221 (+),score=51.24 TRINITY_DN48206_c0_g1_i1:73-663(+)
MPAPRQTQEAPRRRMPSVEPRPSPAPSPPDLQLWVTVYGADSTRLGAVKAALSDRFGLVVDCRVPKRDGNAAHFKFESSAAALMAVQVEKLTVAGIEAYTSACTEEGVLLEECSSFLRIDTKCRPRAIPLYNPPVMLPQGTSAMVRELWPIYTRPGKYIREILVVLILLYITSAMYRHVAPLLMVASPGPAIEESL